MKNHRAIQHLKQAQRYLSEMIVMASQNGKCSDIICTGKKTQQEIHKARTILFNGHYEACKKRLMMNTNQKSIVEIITSLKYQ